MKRLVMLIMLIMLATMLFGCTIAYYGSFLKDVELKKKADEIAIKSKKSELDPEVIKALSDGAVNAAMNYMFAKGIINKIPTSVSAAETNITPVESK